MRRHASLDLLNESRFAEATLLRYATRDNMSNPRANGKLARALADFAVMSDLRGENAPREGAFAIRIRN